MLVVVVSLIRLRVLEWVKPEAAQQLSLAVELALPDLCMCADTDVYVSACAGICLLVLVLVLCAVC